MNTLKNFIIGLVVLILALIIFVIISFTWPFLLGITSLLLALLAGVLFIVLIFYIIVLIGHIARRLIGRQ